MIGEAAQRDNAGALAMHDTGLAIYRSFGQGNILAGGDPIADGWEGGEPDPVTCYEEINNIVDARNGGATMLDL